MFQQPIEPSLQPNPASKWTPEVRIRFLEHLARNGNVRAACLLIGASAETAYRLRRRDRVFARGWDAAMVLARRAAEHVLADRAIDGVVVDIYHRGEWIASQRKYDTRLLLAHLGRLDQQVKPEAEADAERFDEILGAVIGEPVPAAFECEDEVLGTDRERFAEEAARAARLKAEAAAAGTPRDGEEALSDEQRWERQDELEAACADAEDEARAEARWQWDLRHAELCEAIDAALEVSCGDAEAEGAEAPPPEGDVASETEAPEGAADFSLRTVSTPSTPCQPEEDAAGSQTDGAAPQDGLSDDPAGSPPQ